MEDTRKAHPVPASPATGGGSGMDHHHSTEMRQPPHAPSPLRLSISSCRRDRIITSSTPVDEQPDSPTSPPSYTLPNGYSPVMIRESPLDDDYGLPPPPDYNNSPIASYTSRATDASSFQSNQNYVEPFNCDDDVEYGDMYPPHHPIDHCVAVRQDISFAETSLKCYNDDPSNEVKYELVEATGSNYILLGTGDYAHVNFIARAKDQEGSQQELFFAELNLQGQGFATLTCFRSLKEKEDQVGGLLGMEREGNGMDHCYSCWQGLKHPRDGASYHAGHRTWRLRDEFPY